MGYPHISLDCKDHHDLVRDFNGPRPEIVCLCGSTRFRETFERFNQQLTLEGNIVLAPGIWVRSDPAFDDLPEDRRIEIKGSLDELHKRKIDLADWVFVLNVNDYVGESTAAEIAYALEVDTPLQYLEPHDLERYAQ